MHHARRTQQSTLRKSQHCQAGEITTPQAITPWEKVPLSRIARAVRHDRREPWPGSERASARGCLTLSACPTPNPTTTQQNACRRGAHRRNRPGLPRPRPPRQQGELDVFGLFGNLGRHPVTKLEIGHTHGAASIAVNGARSQLEFSLSVLQRMDHYAGCIACAFRQPTDERRSCASGTKPHRAEARKQSRS